MGLAEFLENPKSTTTVKDAARLDPAAKLRKQVFLQFGALVVLGLALAGSYVGYRILAGARTVDPPPPIVATPMPAQVPAPVPAQVPQPVSAPVPTPVLPPVSSPVLPPVSTAAQQPVQEKIKPVAKPEPPPAPTAVQAKPAPVPVAKPAAVAPEIVQPAKPSPPVQRKDSAAQAFSRRDANPRAGEKYLQIAAFGPRALDGFLKTLDAQGLHPVVAPGPVDNIYRILIGPFQSSAALEDARRLIRASGIEPILRAY